MERRYKRKYNDSIAGFLLCALLTALFVAFIFVVGIVTVIGWFF